LYKHCGKIGQAKYGENPANWLAARFKRSFEIGLARKKHFLTSFPAPQHGRDSAPERPAIRPRGLLFIKALRRPGGIVLGITGAIDCSTGGENGCRRVARA
jgi:hypothetical protein